MIILPNDSDHHRIANGTTCQAWMVAEMNFVRPPNDRVRDCYEKAKATFAAIRFEPMLDACLQELRDYLGDYPRPAPTGP